MIFGIVRLTDLNLAQPYCNRILTQFGVLGRAITPAPLAFYKILVKYSYYVLEYVVATSQEFQFPYVELREKISGVTYRDRNLINFAPISVKLINTSTNVCSNHLFVNAISYLLSYSGSLTDAVLEFSRFPSSISEPPLSPMVHDDYCNTISLHEFLKHTYLRENLEVPLATHSLDLGKTISILTSESNTAILANISINDIRILHSIADILDSSIPGGLHTLNSALVEHGNSLMELIPTDPILRDFVNTPSIVRLAPMLKYMDMHNCQLYEKLASSYNPYIGPYPLNRSMKAFHDLHIDELVWAIQGSPVVDLNLHMSSPNNIITDVATTWTGDAEFSQYAAVSAYMNKAYDSLMKLYPNTKLSLSVNKTWLDEISLEVVSVKGIEHHLIPLWVYNLSSPCAINATVVSAILAH